MLHNVQSLYFFKVFISKLLCYHWIICNYINTCVHFFFFFFLSVSQKLAVIMLSLLNDNILLAANPKTCQVTNLWCHWNKCYFLRLQHLLITFSNSSQNAFVCCREKFTSLLSYDIPVKLTITWLVSPDHLSTHFAFRTRFIIFYSVFPLHRFWRCSRWSLHI